MTGRYTVTEPRPAVIKDAHPIQRPVIRAADRARHRESLNLLEVIPTTLDRMAPDHRARVLDTLDPYGEGLDRAGQNTAHAPAQESWS